MNTLAIIFLIAVVVTIVPIINNHLQKYGNIFYIFFFSTKVEYFLKTVSITQVGSQK